MIFRQTTASLAYIASHDQRTCGQLSILLYSMGFPCPHLLKIYPYYYILPLLDTYTQFYYIFAIVFYKNYSVLPTRERGGAKWKSGVGLSVVNSHGPDPSGVNRNENNLILW
jgi:hypothetical protein